MPKKRQNDVTITKLSDEKGGKCNQTLGRVHNSGKHRDKDPKVFPKSSIYPAGFANGPKVCN